MSVLVPGQSLYWLLLISLQQHTHVAVASRNVALDLPCNKYSTCCMAGWCRAVGPAAREQPGEARPGAKPDVRTCIKRSAFVVTHRLVPDPLWDRLLRSSLQKRGSVAEAVRPFHQVVLCNKEFLSLGRLVPDRLWDRLLMSSLEKRRRVAEAAPDCPKHTKICIDRTAFCTAGWCQTDCGTGCS